MFTGIIAFAVLFGLFGLLRPRKGCGHCAGCEKTVCDRSEPDHD